MSEGRFLHQTILIIAMCLSVRLCGKVEHKNNGKLLQFGGDSSPFIWRMHSTCVLLVCSLPSTTSAKEEPGITCAQTLTSRFCIYALDLKKEKLKIN